MRAMPALIVPPRLRQRSLPPSIVAAPVSVPAALEPRVRMREPTPWPNGSAVFANDHRSKNAPKIWGQHYEDQVGFLGRIVSIDRTSYSVWKYRPTGYVHLGNYTWAEGLERLS